MTATIHTPGCAGDEVTWLSTTDRNRRLSSAVFHYLKCRRCELIRLDNVPPDLSPYYPTAYYELPTATRLANIAESDRFKIDLVQQFAHGGRLMEVGPAHGVFAFQARRAGFDVDVVEMDARSCEHLAGVVGVNVICSAAPQDVLRERTGYDVIALWQVIEHVPDPWTLLEAAAQALAPNGILVIAAPNPGAWQLKVMGAEWPHLDAPRHLYLLPPGVVTQHVASVGLRGVHCTSADADAKRWNRFGWQRLLMNRIRGKWGQRAGFVAGFGLAALLAPLERAELRGSTYTLVFQRA